MGLLKWQIHSSKLLIVQGEVLGDIDEDYPFPDLLREFYVTNLSQHVLSVGAIKRV